MHADQAGQDLRVGAGELAVSGESGVVDQQVGSGRGDGLLQAGQVARIGQVRGVGVYAHAVLSGQPAGEGLQPVAAAGGDEQVPAVGGQPAGERLPESGGCSGDEAQHDCSLIFAGGWPRPRAAVAALAGDEPAGLAGLGVAGDVGDLPDADLRIGQAGRAQAAF